MEQVHPRHLRELTRQFRLVPRVNGIGHMQRKKSWVRHSFRTLNFSFILDGGGEYFIHGRRYIVDAPCVITQWPDVHVEYGPSRGHEFWEELFLIYGREELSRWHLGTGVSIRRPVWALPQTDALMRVIALLREELAQPPSRENVDRIDCLCYWLVCESLQCSHGLERDESEERILRLARELLGRLDDDICFHELARETGFSYATLRRNWSRYLGEPPGKWLMNKRLELGCRLLVESQASIAEVAQTTGFQDPLYFSRCFRRRYGMAPREYRSQHKMFPD